MKTSIIFFYFFIVLFSVSSCKKESNSATPNTNQSEFLEVIINGQKFYESKPFGLNVGTSVGNPNLCDNKLGIVAFHTTTQNNQFECNASLIHYRSNSDLSSISPGNFTLIDDWSRSFLNGVLPCNLTLEMKIYDNGESLVLLNNSIHKVTSISKITEIGNAVQYLIVGSFSGNYKNSSNANYSVSGNYSMLVEVFK